MHDDDDEPIYWSNTTWAELLHTLNINEELRHRLGVKLCPFSGRVEEYTMADQLGGMLNIWPEKWRDIIEAGLLEMAAAA